MTPATVRAMAPSFRHVVTNRKGKNKRGQEREGHNSGGILQMLHMENLLEMEKLFLTTQNTMRMRVQREIMTKNFKNRD
ncbi:hypothetical protein E2562_017777 [Oryza meyeriana var. granulata]|uniref:No apical meristem-associated C-terminal domain-containing protein n=1 Tax=Oryza meyeriana var. granulata TaxID=110450 RepID=A0A6G1BLV7_9ORYZ|nr:hypothetical protein E2562_017777 [Oryza meyeriana var. granulata]